jgi:hypothetical protein
VGGRALSALSDDPWPIETAATVSIDLHGEAETVAVIDPL